MAKELRERGWAVSYVARTGGISTAMLNGILASRREPGKKTYRALSKVFNVPLSTLEQLGSTDTCRGSHRLANEMIAMVPLLDEEQLPHAHYMLSSMLKAKSIKRGTEIAPGVSPEKERCKDEVT